MRFSNPLHVPSIRLPEGFWSLGGGFEAWIGDFGARRARPSSYSSPLWVFAPFYLPSAEISKKSHFPTLPAGPLQTPSVWFLSSRSCSAGRAGCCRFPWQQSSGGTGWRSFRTVTWQPHGSTCWVPRRTVTCWCCCRFPWQRPTRSTLWRPFRTVTWRYGIYAQHTLKTKMHR